MRQLRTVLSLLLWSTYLFSSQASPAEKSKGSIFNGDPIRVEDYGTPPATFTIPLYDCTYTHRPKSDDPAAFQVLHNKEWYTQFCQQGLIWNQTMCRCEYPNGKRPEVECRDYRATSNEPAGKYEQFVNNQWIVRDCSLAVAGLVWDQKACQCVWGPDSKEMVIGQGITPCDIMLNMTFENGMKDEAKDSFVEVGRGIPVPTYTLNQQDAVDGSRAAYFSETALNIWYFASNEMGTSLRVEFRFKMTNDPDQRDKYQIFISNGCNVSSPGYTTPSLAIGYRAADQSYLLAFETVTARKAIVCTRKLGAYDWHTISLIYEDGTLLFRVDDYPCIISQDFAGPVQKTPCPLTIGADPLERQSMYKGYLDNLLIARYCRRYIDQEQGENEVENKGPMPVESAPAIADGIRRSLDGRKSDSDKGGVPRKSSSHGQSRRGISSSKYFSEFPSFYKSDISVTGHENSAKRGEFSNGFNGQEKGKTDGHAFGHIPPTRPGGFEQSKEVTNGFVGPTKPNGYGQKPWYSGGNDRHAVPQRDKGAGGMGSDYPGNHVANENMNGHGKDYGMVEPTSGHLRGSGNSGGPSLNYGSSKKAQGYGNGPVGTRPERMHQQIDGNMGGRAEHEHKVAGPSQHGMPVMNSGFQGKAPGPQQFGQSEKTFPNVNPPQIRHGNPQQVNGFRHGQQDLGKAPAVQKTFGKGIHPSSNFGNPHQVTNIDNGQQNMGKAPSVTKNLVKGASPSPTFGNPRQLTSFGDGQQNMGKAPGVPKNFGKGVNPSSNFGNPRPVTGFGEGQLNMEKAPTVSKKLVKGFNPSPNFRNPRPVTDFGQSQQSTGKAPGVSKNFGKGDNPHHNFRDSRQFTSFGESQQNMGKTSGDPEDIGRGDSHSPTLGYSGKVTGFNKAGSPGKTYGDGRGGYNDFGNPKDVSAFANGFKNQGKVGGHPRDVGYSGSFTIRHGHSKPPNQKSPHPSQTFENSGRMEHFDGNDGRYSGQDKIDGFDDRAGNSGNNKEWANDNGKGDDFPGYFEFSGKNVQDVSRQNSRKNQGMVSEKREGNAGTKTGTFDSSSNDYESFVENKGHRNNFGGSEKTGGTRTLSKKRNNGQSSKFGRRESFHDSGAHTNDNNFIGPRENSQKKNVVKANINEGYGRADANNQKFVQSGQLRNNQPMAESSQVRHGGNGGGSKIRSSKGPMISRTEFQRKDMSGDDGSVHSGSPRNQHHFSVNRHTGEMQYGLGQEQSDKFAANVITQDQATVNDPTVFHTGRKVENNGQKHRPAPGRLIKGHRRFGSKKKAWYDRVDTSQTSKSGLNQFERQSSDSWQTDQQLGDHEVLRYDDTHGTNFDSTKRQQAGDTAPKVSGPQPAYYDYEPDEKFTDDLNKDYQPTYDQQRDMTQVQGMKDTGHFRTQTQESGAEYYDDDGQYSDTSDWSPEYTDNVNHEANGEIDLDYKGINHQEKDIEDAATNSESYSDFVDEDVDDKDYHEDFSSDDYVDLPDERHDDTVYVHTGRTHGVPQSDSSHLDMPVDVTKLIKPKSSGKAKGTHS